MPDVSDWSLLPESATKPWATFALCRSFQRKINELQLVDLVGELEDEDLVELEALRATAGVVEELQEGVGKLMP